MHRRAVSAICTVGTSTAVYEPFDDNQESQRARVDRDRNAAKLNF
jgi:hypothetical protein